MKASPFFGGVGVEIVLTILCVVLFITAFLYRQAYKKLRYLALAGCSFKEDDAGFLEIRLEGHVQWYALYKSFKEARRPQNRVRHQLVSVADDGNDDTYKPGQWKKEK
jgi:hypothetical protein